MRVAVVGHVEWIEFARVRRVPEPGAIVHASETWEEPGGGGAVAAVQLAKLAGGAVFFTALGNDALGHRAFAELTALGLRVEAAWRDESARDTDLYFQCAAMPNSAVRCIERVRICTSIGLPVGPTTVVCSDWYKLNLGIAM